MQARVLQAFLGVLIALVVAGSLVLGTLAVVQQAGQAAVVTRVTCQQVNRLRTALVAILQRGERDLPGQKQYQDNPAALAQAEQQFAEDEAPLQPIQC